MEGLNKKFWKDKKILLTGNTGFKGVWMTFLLNELGAQVHGYSNNLEIKLYSSLKQNRAKTFLGDINNLKDLKNCFNTVQPEILIHFAAQPLVRESYKNPVETFETNALGTVKVLEAARFSSSIELILIITTDKCYENNEQIWGYRENDKLGGFDPYSASKACAEIITNSYWNSFFKDKGVLISSARAGNVIGGGDYSVDRLVPDIIHSYNRNIRLSIRNPNSTRPWQFVLEPLFGYLILIERMADSKNFCGNYNFGPNLEDCVPVNKILNLFKEKLTTWCGWEIDESNQPHEASLLYLDCTKAYTKLSWKPKTNLEQAVDFIIEFNNLVNKNPSNVDMIIEYQIRKFINL